MSRSERALRAHEERAEEAQLDRQGACPACQVPAGKPCTTPTDTGRREVKWTHVDRHDARVGWA